MTPQSKQRKINAQDAKPCVQVEANIYLLFYLSFQLAPKTF